MLTIHSNDGDGSQVDLDRILLPPGAQPPTGGIPDAVRVQSRLGPERGIAGGARVAWAVASGSVPFQVFRSTEGIVALCTEERST